MYLIICLYAALLLTACGSDKEPLFRPTVPAAPAPAATDENADSRAPDKHSAPSPKTETLTTDTSYSGGYDSDIYITSGYTQSTEVWFPQTPGIGDNNHPKHMVFRLLGEDTAKAYPIFPEDGLLMNRTGSRYSLVGPAVTRQRIGLAFMTSGSSLTSVTSGRC